MEEALGRQLGRGCSRTNHSDYLGREGDKEAEENKKEEDKEWERERERENPCQAGCCYLSETLRNLCTHCRLQDSCTPMAYLTEQKSSLPDEPVICATTFWSQQAVPQVSQPMSMTSLPC